MSDDLESVLRNRQSAAASHLMRDHRYACMKAGDHPLEADTPYSLGADALRRVPAQAARITTLEAQLAEAVEALEASREAHCGLAEFFLRKPMATREECSGTFTDSQNARLAIDRALAKIKGAQG